MGLRIQTSNLTPEEYFKAGFKEGVKTMFEERFAQVASFIRCNIYNYVDTSDDDIEINTSDLLNDLCQLMEDKIWNF